MIRLVQKQVPVWNANNTKIVWMEGAGPKAFCAGGDVRSLYDAKIDDNDKEKTILDSFFREEFTMDYSLATMKPT